MSATSRKLSWVSGDPEYTHDVYFGDDRAAVTAATPASPEYRGNQSATTFPVTGLEGGKSYYWRIDEVASDGERGIGGVWEFHQETDAASLSNGLLLYWPMEEGTGATVADASGNGNHGDVAGAAWTADGRG